MTALTPAALPGLAARGISVPGYDRAGLRPGLVHIGVGAFHRCHQADHTEDLISAGQEDRFVTGLTLRPPAIEPVLTPQAGLYTRTLVQGDDRDTRVIGCLRQVVDGLHGSAPLLRVLADPAMTVATLTVTEKGYCHIPATGALNDRHPDIVADLAAPHAPVSLPGLLAEALDRRRIAGAPGMTLVSCDNVPGNGQVLRGAVLAMAAARGGALTDWIAGTVHFPATMVDRIVPATTEADRAALLAATGIADAAPVIGEPFRQWVIEATGAPDLPRWDLAGAEFAADVTAHEAIKMRLLNGAQSAMAHIGCLLGLDTTADGIRDPDMREFLHRMLTRETAPTLPQVAGMEPGPYVARSFARLENRAIRHTNHQIATDGSQKIVQRLLRPADERRAQGHSSPLLTAAAAAWAAGLACAAPRYGARLQVPDPLATRVLALAQSTAGSQMLANAILDLAEVFPAALAGDARFRADFAAALDGWLTRPPREALRRHLAAATSAAPG